MKVLSQEDQNKVLTSLPKLKTVVSLETIKSECDDEVLKQLFEDMLDLALRYTESVCLWQRIVNENGASFDEHGTRQAIEATRTSVHDAFNDQVNILSRTMSRLGKSVEWRDRIGHDRSRLGCFALSISFEYIKQNKGGAI